MDRRYFNEDFIKNYNEESDEAYFLEVNVQYPEKLHNLPNDLPLLHERWRLKKLKALLLIYMIKLNCHSNKKLKTSINSWINFEKSSWSD